MTRRDPDLGGFHHSARHHPVWGFGTDDMAAVQQQHDRQARRLRRAFAVGLVVLWILGVVVGWSAASLGWWT
jgi:hypothetical protein